MSEENVKPEMEEQVSEIIEEKPERRRKRIRRKSTARRRKIIVAVDETLWARLWKLVKRKYDSPWRAYSNEVRIALKKYLDEQGV